MEKAVDVNEQLIRLARKTENPEKFIAQQDLWLKKVTEMNDKVMHEAQSYKMSLRNWIEIIKNADKFNLPIIQIYSWFFSTSNSSYGDWAHILVPHMSYRGYVSSGRSPRPRSNFAPFFVAPDIRRTGFAYVRQFRVAKNSNWYYVHIPWGRLSRKWKFYMDDYLDSFENITHAIKISCGLLSILKLGGFIWLVICQ